MSLKNDIPKIESGKPFENCKLDRQKYAQVLTGLVSNYNDGFVLAINNKWGTGKTTFVKMWRQYLDDEEFQTVYFNAWENDFEDNPLSALMGELKMLTNKQTKPKFQKALKNAAILSKHLTPVIAEAIIDKYLIDTKNLKEAILSATDSANEIFENEVNNYQEKKSGIEDFRKSLSKFIEETNKGKPIIFIVDELDRCRPNYAVSILEQIKHFFSVKNIVFVLSIDKNQLGNAIRGVYGSDKIDSDEYLRRFIDIEYSIPKPENDLFYKYLFEKLNFKEYFDEPTRKRYNELIYDKDNFFDTCKLLFNNSDIPLRQQERILILSRLSLRSFSINNYLIPTVYLFLIYIKVLHQKFYEEIKLKSLDYKELQEKFFEVIKDKITDSNKRRIMYLEVYLLIFYNNYRYEHHTRPRLYENGDTYDDKNILIQSIFGEDSNKEFINTILSIERTNYNSTNMSLEHFIKKIELLEPIKM